MNIGAPILATVCFVASLFLAGVCYAVHTTPPDAIWTLAGVALGVVGGVSMPALRPPSV